MHTQCFRDFDAFANSVRDADFEMLLENPQRPEWRVSQIDLSAVHIQLGQEGSGNITEGQSLPEGYVVFMPFTHARAHSANGRSLDEKSFAILEPGCAFCLRASTEHDWCTVFIPTEKLAGVGSAVRPFSRSAKGTCRVVRTDVQLARRFRNLIQLVVNAASTCAGFETQSAATYAAKELLQVAAEVVAWPQENGSNHEGRPHIPREEIIRRSKQLLERRDGDRVLVGELADAAEVSERTLRSAFNEYFGVGPVRYLQLRQLHQVHRALRAAHFEEVSVSDLLVRHGEWEFSRFAARYRRLFGKLPSETLRAGKR